MQGGQVLPQRHRGTATAAQWCCHSGTVAQLLSQRVVPVQGGQVLPQRRLRGPDHPAAAHGAPAGPGNTLPPCGPLARCLLSEISFLTQCLLSVRGAPVCWPTARSWLQPPPHPQQCSSHCTHACAGHLHALASLPLQPGSQVTTAAMHPPGTPAHHQPPEQLAQARPKKKPLGAGTGYRPGGPAPPPSQPSPCTLHPKP